MSTTFALPPRTITQQQPRVAVAAVPSRAASAYGPIEGAEFGQLIYGPERGRFTGPRRPGRQGPVLNPTTGDEAIMDFVATHPNCARPEDLRRFVELVNGAALNGIDLTAIAEALAIANVVPQSVERLRRASRTAGMQFQEQTLGVRGSRLNVVEPSLMWAIAEAECGWLPQLNQGIEAVLRGEFGFEVPPGTMAAPKPLTGTPQESTQRNNAVAFFISQHPQCLAFYNGDTRALGNDIRTLLNLLDSMNLTAERTFDLIRDFDIELAERTNANYLRLFSKYGWRSGRRELTEATPGLRGSQRYVLKPGLLWALTEHECGDLPQLIQFLNGILRQASGASAVAGMQPQQPFGTQQQEQPMEYAPTNPFAPGATATFGGVIRRPTTVTPQPVNPFAVAAQAQPVFQPLPPQAQRQFGQPPPRPNPPAYAPAGRHR